MISSGARATGLKVSSHQEGRHKAQILGRATSLIVGAWDVKVLVRKPWHGAYGAYPFMHVPCHLLLVCDCDVDL